jgi:microcystin-dependent protein
MQWTNVSPASLGFTSGMMVTAYKTANPAVYAQGTVCSYSGNTLNIWPTYSQGTYTGSGWTIQISGPQGPQGATGATSAPVGSLNLWASSSLPANYLWASGPNFVGCEPVGSTGSTYNGLYLQIGDTWTAQNGCVQGTTFGIPDMRGRFPLGAGQGNTAGSGGSGTLRTLGQLSNGDPNLGATIAGAETHTQATGEVGMHSHTITDPGHYHQINNYQGTPGLGPYMENSAGSSVNVYGNTYTQLQYTGIGINTSPAPSPMNIMTPFDVLNFIIRYQ